MAYVAQSYLPFEVLTSTKMNQVAANDASFHDGTGLPGAWTSYTPTLTNVTTGNGTVAGSYIKIGKTVFFHARFTLGSTSAFTGTVRLSLPLTSINYGTGYAKILGNVSYWDASASVSSVGVVSWVNTTTAEPDTLKITTSPVHTAATNGSLPFVWGTGDILDMHGFYEAA